MPVSHSRRDDARELRPFPFSAVIPAVAGPSPPLEICGGTDGVNRWGVHAAEKDSVNSVRHTLPVCASVRVLPPALSVGGNRNGFRHAFPGTSNGTGYVAPCYMAPSTSPLCLRQSKERAGGPSIDPLPENA